MSEMPKHAFTATGEDLPLQGLSSLTFYEPVKRRNS